MRQMYDIHSFIERIKDKDFHEIIKEAEKETYLTERGSFGVKGAVKKRESGSVKYANNLKMLLFFMSHGTKPTGISDSVFFAFKPICKSLVTKKQFKPKIMKLFENQ